MRFKVGLGEGGHPCKGPRVRLRRHITEVELLWVGSAAEEP